MTWNFHRNLFFTGIYKVFDKQKEKSIHIPVILNIEYLVRKYDKSFFQLNSNHIIFVRPMDYLLNFY